MYKSGLRIKKAITFWIYVQISVTNPIDVIKIRMQLDNELASTKGNVSEAIKKRYYKGFLRGAVTIAKDEGVAGLYKGWIQKHFFH